MVNDDELAGLVQKARLGDRGSMDRLAEAAAVRLREYVFRLTLQEDLTQDIVQESILEMFRVFNKLDKAERFWSWLHGIAFNKIRSHYGRQWRHRTISLSNIDLEAPARDSQNGLAGMINRELKQVVIRSMQELSPRHRAVLTMRCYEQMPYSKIAELMGCSEFSAQALFYRAKKSLAKKLSHHGLGKQYLLAALILFGKMTATTEATAAEVSVTAAALKVSAAASVAAMVTSKTAIVSLATAGVIVGGSVATKIQTPETADTARHQVSGNSPSASLQHLTEDGAEQCWYFYPEGAGKSVMTRLVASNDSGKSTYCQLLENQHANYYCSGDTVFINNFHTYSAKLSVRRLPTDTEELTQFLSEVEGKQGGMEYVSGMGKGLLVISKRSRDQGNTIWRIDRHFNVLEEEYFQFDWPSRARVVDNRDAMHKRGWTYFRISGEVNDEPISGTGRMPFVYAASRRFAPWLELKLANGWRIVDDGVRACVLDGSGNAIAAYEGGSFFRGLARPWMGLHTIDVVRRDAAEQHLWYETRLVPGGSKVEVVLACDQVEFVYTIDLETDVVDKIAVTRSEGGRAELRFSYLQDIDGLGSEFTQPRAGSNRRARQEPPGMLWLAAMADGRR